jgi:dipeptidase
MLFLHIQQQTTIPMNMKKLSLTLLAIFLLAGISAAQTQWIPVNPDDENFLESCTSIMVGKKASTDGSVMTAHTCDSNYRTWVEMTARKSFKPGDTEPVYWGTLHNEEPWDTRNVVEKGRIPAVEETFAYLNTAYPCLNEKQLAIGETTITGRDVLVNKNGLFLIEELERIALQRCSTARDAIKLIGKLVETYGYGDSGECITIADKKEVWQLELFGSGAGKPSAIWVAQRIPDDHVGISANIPRISTVDFNNPEYFMYSSDIKERCKKLGLWDGKEEFKFWKINNGRKPFSIREFFVLNSVAPSLNLKYDSEELPFSVKPDKKISVRDVMAFYRETYEGTEWDQTKNLVAEVSRRDSKGNEYKDTIKPVSNFMSNEMRALLNTIKPGATERVRGIAVIQCSYSHIIQLRDWLPDEVGGVAYFSFDNPAQSPRIPIYSGTISLPKSFSVCGQHRYREDAAIWAYRETNRIATINWDKTRGILEPEIARFEEEMFRSAPAAEKLAEELIKSGKVKEARELLTKRTNDFALSTMQSWKDMKAQLWSVFARAM